MGRVGRVKSKGSEASTSQDGDTPKPNRVGKRPQGRPRKSAGADAAADDSPSFSRDSTPFSPANPHSLKRRTAPGEPRLTSLIAEFDSDEDIRLDRLARFLDEHPDSREEFSKLMEDRPSFPPWIEEKDQIEHEGWVYRTGDIVCLFDEEDDADEEEEYEIPYYAQIRSLISDQFMRPYAWITWLVPKGSAPDPHEFEPEHFVHSLVDHKLYELECLRWECDRPELPAYQTFDDHRAVLDKHRLAQLRQRRVELFKAAHFEMSKGCDIVRSGDVKLAHSKEHADELKEVMERQLERAIERREEMEKRAAETDTEREKRKRFSSLPVNRSHRSGSADELSDDDAEEGEEEGERKRKVPERRMRGRTGSLASTTSKATNESVESAKPME
ncbi:hypothetical protein PENTCL1PPCAC_18939 [Pristionchus entomophagus]|uniref:Uncharacterized protein n=1 Tax=Pristionchus entomophagus TaxID=358040 RepID=A0AAV5TQQ5_9BILA|nr:hypothetical protein PENTCL1PPCAC_18939 [Pristionchus entomophagus]